MPSYTDLLVTYDPIVLSYSVKTLHDHIDLGWLGPFGLPAPGRGPRPHGSIPSRKLSAVGRHRAFGRVDHRHDVELEAGSRLAAVLGDQASINSVHHQAIREPGEGLAVVARAPDGVIEGVESVSSERLLWLLQWHPEREPGEAAGTGVFEAFVAAARRDS